MIILSKIRKKYTGFGLFYIDVRKTKLKITNNRRVKYILDYNYKVFLNKEYTLYKPSSSRFSTRFSFNLFMQLFILRYQNSTDLNSRIIFNSYQKIRVLINCISAKSERVVSKLYKKNNTQN